MSEQDDGGMAFPMDFGGRIQPQGGMPLRDYFAAKVAIQDDVSIRSAETVVGRKMPDFASQPLENSKFWAEYRSCMRYIEADAMLKARSQP